MFFFCSLFNGGTNIKKSTTVKTDRNRDNVCLAGHKHLKHLLAKKLICKDKVWMDRQYANLHLKSSHFDSKP